MLLYNCQNLAKSFALRKLFEEISFSIFQKDRIGLIGPNGSGKSTLLKILAGLETADEGILAPRKGLKIGYVPQTCEFPHLSPQEVLIASIDEPMNEYEKEHLAEMWLSKLQLKGEVAALLSGGWKKRLAFACQWIKKPDLILYDEPTNHLDLEGILWLEGLLQRESPTYICVSHDRYFLQNTTSRVIEISPSYPGGLFIVDGPYPEFLKRKGEFLSGQIKQEASLASKARREEAWLRQGAKARTTKAQSRIDDAEEIFEEHREVARRNVQKKAELQFVASERQTRKLLNAKNLGKGALFSHLDFLLSPGTRLSLTGPNGSGKTTLLRMLAGEIEPDQGTIKRADDLKVVYFDQHRTQLPDHLTLKEALSPNGDYVIYHGRPIHVNGWCKRFLFSPDLLALPIRTLSGGERARIAIAHLMLQPADLLLLDEPTNDLDIQTLETLEESLLEFPGAVVLITHDRCMQERICNQTIALGAPLQKESPKKVEERKTVKGKLSYMEKKEYEESEAKIAILEAQIATLNQELGTNDPEKLNTLCKEIALLETKIEQAYLRFDELDRKLKG